MGTSEIDLIVANLAVSSNQLADDLQQDHPRFHDYKNEGKIAEKQRKRREEHLQRQNRAREDWLERYRNIENDDLNEHEQKHQQNPFAQRRQSPKKPKSANPYADCLMHSDWLVDIPESLSTEWTLVPSPVGRRCLVVAQKGYTSVYYRNGRFAFSFSSPLPGGNSSSTIGTTILDCICSNRYLSKSDKFYVLDLLWWGNRMYTDLEFSMRQFFLRSKLEEFEEMNSKNSRKLVPLPSCPCSPEEITKFMQQEFPYDLDGLLFYYNSAHYIPEQTPLVGWLKPWMLPEILGVPIPEKYMQSGGNVNCKDYIADYNKKHGHMSSAEIKANKMEIEVETGNTEDDGSDGTVPSKEKAEEEVMTGGTGNN